METIALRLVLPPLVIALASLAQTRLGDRLGGLVVGLPLTSGTFLGLLYLSHGPEALAHAAAGILGGQIAVVVMCVAYATAARRHSPAVALLAAVIAWTVTITLVHRLVHDALVAAVGHALLALTALSLWPKTSAREGASPQRRARHYLLVRVAIGSALVLALTAGVQSLGPALAGSLAAAPLVALALSPSTHGQRGAGAVRDLLGGVVRGSVGAAAFALVVVGSAHELGGLSIVAATAACLAVVGVLGRLDSLRA